MRKAITTKEFTLSCIFNGLNTIIWAYFFITTLTPKTFLFLTSISGDLNSIYLLLSLICDISYFCFNSEKLEILNNLLRNKVSNILNPMSYLVTILFWALFFMGGMDDMDTLYDIIFNVYEHIFITLFVILDIIVSHHERHYFSKLTLLFIYIYLILYGVVCGVSTFVFDNPPYPFLKKIKTYVLIIYCIIFIFVTFICYLFHIFIYKMKYKCMDKGIILVNESIGPNSSSSRPSSE